MSIKHAQVFITGALCFAAVLSSAGAAAAEASTVAAPQDREPVQFTYRFDASELETTPGTRRLYRKLVVQAQRACTDAPSTMTDLKRVDRKCAAALVGDVVQRIGSPSLAALHAASPAAHALAATPGERNFVGSL